MNRKRVITLFVTLIIIVGVFAYGFHSMKKFKGNYSETLPYSFEAKEIDYTESTVKQQSSTTNSKQSSTTKPASTLSWEEENFQDLTMDDKVDIVEWIQSEGMYTSTDDLWEEIAEEYGITEDMVDEINNDPDVAYALGRRNKTRNEATQNSIQYDATLSYGSGTVAVGATKEDLDEFLTNVSNYDTSANSVMVYEGRLALVEEGTKVKVLDRRLSTTKVRVLEGLFEGFEGWTIMEAVHNK